MSSIISFVIGCIVLAFCLAIGFFCLNVFITVAVLIIGGFATLCSKIGEWFVRLIQ